MKARWQQTAATVAILAAIVSAAAGQTVKDPLAARAFLKELIAPAPLSPEVRRRIGKLLADLGSGTWKVREAASKELLRIGAKAGPLIGQAAKSPDAEVAARVRELLEAYKASQEDRDAVLNEAVDLLAGRRDKTAVDSMVVLLDHADGSIRHVAEYGLRRITGMRFGYNAHAPKNERRAAAAKWAAWWKAGREKFDFAPADNRSQLAGILCWSRATRDVYLVGLDGKVIWSRRMPKRPRSADALPNGNILVSFCVSGQPPMVEYDPDGKVVWSTKDLELGGFVRDVTRLPNGNTLAVDMTGRRVIEIDPAGKRIVWQYPFVGSIYAAQRLANGNTLLCSTNGYVREITKTGKVVWSKTILGHTRDAQKLANGNVLIVEPSRGRVVELTISGREAWSWAGTGVGARRLPDGRTVVQAGGTCLLLVDPTGKSATPLAMPDARFTCYREFRLAPAGAERTAKGKWNPPTAP